jgi:hypothetical protein
MGPRRIQAASDARATTPKAIERLDFNPVANLTRLLTMATPVLQEGQEIRSS